MIGGRFGRAQFSDTIDSAELTEELLALPPLRPVDEAATVARPDVVAKFYAEEFFEAKAEQQPLLWTARGEEAARPWLAEAAELEPFAREHDFLIGEARKQVHTSGERYGLTAKALSPYARRAVNAKRGYIVRAGGLVVGDIVGVAGAAIILGEPTWLALLQALASGTAAVTSGVLAHEVKDSRLARKRQKESKKLTREEKRFAHLFRGGDSGERLVKIVVGGGLLIGICIAGSIFALRAVTEGSTAGWAFGLLAAAITLASWANVYAFTDEAADLIDAQRSAFKTAVKELANVRGDSRIARRSRAVANAASIRSEHQQRGEAARREVEAAGKRHLHENPGVAGHGWPAAAAAPGQNGHRSHTPEVSDTFSEGSASD